LRLNNFRVRNNTASNESAGWNANSTIHHHAISIYLKHIIRP
jgi:hypothetical protein